METLALESRLLRRVMEAYKTKMFSVYIHSSCISLSLVCHNQNTKQLDSPAAMDFTDIIQSIPQNATIEEIVL